MRLFLDQKVEEYNRPSFIETDPIIIPRSFSLQQDVEIAGFLAATIAWGNRKSIINSARRMMTIMGNEPYRYVMDASPTDLKETSGFVHRTFNGDDLLQFVHSLRRIYHHYNSMEAAFSGKNVAERIHNFKHFFFEGEHLKRTEKHVSDPYKGSAAKRINMFLRWMVRKDHNGVDLGIWNNIPMSDLICPLDVHSGNVARKLGLLKRKNNDWKAAEELTNALRKMDAQDPVKYDFALFGLGVFERF